MFYYYGSKSKIINYYPKPKHDLIIEPFAGSAKYSLKYFEKDVLLVDKYEIIVKIWLWLQNCSPNDIIKLPRLKAGEKLSDYNLSEIERLFLGFMIAGGATSPHNKCSVLGEKSDTPNMYKNIANNLYKIKHWKIKLGSYEGIENQCATWFIDPPYQYGGSAYYESNKNLNYFSLAEWCKNRQGQIIVCENTKANWLNFTPIVKIQGAKNQSTIESIWTNEKINLSEQISIRF